ncbi:class I SAM-dependent methyltransferase [Denitratisoma oestradiolicum]|uniref:SAM-dependent methyltransferase n=1 Tax=Denitratisoma oestradiolicum TaxID=311182 RepID=A0A6S6YCT0_9PROT|nr:class I SAM-dependent methyltransferase [Denitratisoma oestradiolicum]TWO78851.1 SAM-dependent methyltransferase [Denitratisoma oestradiolicum]CAB1370496.1 SAM-dependent methyltransferase [Denitratisoma oestradiolicum]
MALIDRCRSCGEPLGIVFADLGLSPVSNAFIKPERAGDGEVFYPLRARVCESCWLVQLDIETHSDMHFHEDYVYFSSFSTSWLDHARRYVEAMIPRFGLGEASRIVEVASNDGYLLQYFVQAGIPCLGIEPTANTAAAARQKGVETREMFFGRETARQLAREPGPVDLLLGNNVLAHVPDINDFVGGMPEILKPQGVVTLEFPHLLRLIEGKQFDTIYHEHYSYLSLSALLPIFARAHLRVFDVEHLPTHGGSLRVFVCRLDAAHVETPAVAACLAAETAAGLCDRAVYAGFAEKVREIKRALLAHLIEAKRQGRRIAAYGAAAKGNTLLNYCGIGTDFIDCVADRNPIKQGRLLPGTRIPVVTPEAMLASRPDEVLILPWNIRDEVMTQLGEIRTWGGRFIVPIPRLEVV